MPEISISAFIAKHNPVDIKRLRDILQEHKKWLENHEEGQCACLVDMDLTKVDLSNADLSYANLAGTNLLKATLSGANFTGANLKCADLYCTDMDNTIFVDANLSSARLIYAQRAYWADFTNADLSGVDTCDCSLNEEKMKDAKNFHTILLCPDEGSFIAWKKCSDDCIVKLLIPESAKRAGTCRYTLRASEAKVLEIRNKEGNLINEANSHNEPSFAYKTGEIVRPKEDFDDHMFLDGSGIHFFLTRAEAESYSLPRKNSAEDDE